MTRRRSAPVLLLVLAAGILLVDVLAALQGHAILGARRRTAIVTAAVVSSSKDAEYAQKEQAAESQPQPKTSGSEQPAPAPEPAKADGTLPLGTIVRELPGGCTETTVGDVSYQKCGPDYYRAAFQGSQLVYVTTRP